MERLRESAEASWNNVYVGWDQHSGNNLVADAQQWLRTHWSILLVNGEASFYLPPTSLPLCQT